MKDRSTTRKHGQQAGIALLISIFILLLISVVAIALIVASGTESAMAGNYRSATGVYYAALAGLEEARGRLVSKNPTSFKNTAAALVATVPLPVGSPFYIINPVAGENVAPWDPASNYPDTEFNPEFLSSGKALPNPSPSTNSVSTVAGIQGPSFKWVRVNAVSEASLNLDVDNDANKDQTTPIYYDSATSKLNTTGAGYQVFEITSFAVLANGSQKLLQYLVALVPINFPVPPTSLPALTIAGSVANGVAFSAPTTNGSYYVSGIDLTTIPFCTAGPSVTAVGVFNNSDVSNVKIGGNGGTGIPIAMRPQYTGNAGAPDVFDVSGSFGLLQTPSQFDAFAQTIIQNADVIITPSGGPALGSNLTPLGMTPSNPMTVVINGDLDLNGWHNTGYGLILVTGSLNYDPDASWQGMVLVIGKGTVIGSKAGTGEFDGAFIVAKTRDALGNLLPDPDLGKASMIFANNMGGTGMRYSSCWIQKAMPTASYKILSFHEISQ